MNQDNIKDAEVHWTELIHQYYRQPDVDDTQSAAKATQLFAQS